MCGSYGTRKVQEGERERATLGGNEGSLLRGVEGGPLKAGPSRIPYHGCGGMVGGHLAHPPGLFLPFLLPGLIDLLALEEFGLVYFVQLVNDGSVH